MQRLIIGVLAVLAVPAVVYLWPGPKPASHVYFDAAPKDRLEIIAHGGGLAVAPENTLVSLATAAAMNTDVLEVDLNLSKDGQLIIIHDHTLDRTTDTTGLVADRTAAELRLVDAGHGFRDENGDRDLTFIGQGIYPPTLDEAFDAHPNARWVTEIKNPGVEGAQALCRKIKEYGVAERVLVGSFHDDAMSAFRTDCPEVATSMSPGEIGDFYFMARWGLSRFVSTPAVAIQIPTSDGGHDLTNSRFLSALKARGIVIQYWTINDVAEMQRLASKGADGLITDYVEVMLEKQR